MASRLTDLSAARLSSFLTSALCFCAHQPPPPCDVPRLQSRLRDWAAILGAMSTPTSALPRSFFTGKKSSETTDGMQNSQVGLAATHRAYHPQRRQALEHKTTGIMQPIPTTIGFVIKYFLAIKYASTLNATPPCTI